MDMSHSTKSQHAYETELSVASDQIPLEVAMATKGISRTDGNSGPVVRHNDSNAALKARGKENQHNCSERLRDIFGQTSVGIAQTDLNGRFMFVNQRYCEIVGRAAEELYDLSMQDITHADDSPDNMVQFQRLITEGHEFTVEKRYVRPGGSSIWIHNSVSLIRDVEGNPTYVVAFTTDITSQKKKMRERERLWDGERVAHHELAEVDHRKDLFLAVLGHELRNPLSDIVGAVRILEQLGHEADAQDMYGVIKRQSLHMTKLIDELLDISRISSGRILLHFDRFDLAELVKNAIADHKHHVDTNHLALVVELPEAPIFLVGDATRLSQVVTNLLHNATKFTEPGGTINVCLTASDTSAMLSVRDTGVGILSTELAEMFEPFRQAESCRGRSQGGLGLGLALAKLLIEKHGGTIAALSEGLGRGSVFSVQLPLDLNLAPGQAPITPPAAAATIAHRILVVDDRRDARLVLTVLLKKLGHHVVETENGATALETARTFHPEIVLCDIGLPDMDGYAVARAMRADPALKGMTLVAVTGYGQAEDRERAFAAGFDQHLTKPIGYDDLVDLLLNKSTGSANVPE